MEIFETNNFQETKDLGKELSKKVFRGGIVCLEGELGAGKTTFTQGLLEGLNAEGPYTSPTFLIMKKYGENIFHLDAYRVGEEDILDLGWDELIQDEKNIIIVEWSDRIKNIIPKNAIRINFEWIEKDKRKIIFN